ncbi:Indigoidine synthase A like protein-domain-containing protein [Naematelia encephala]|uniref:Indigoidine synthase A like protein-domain-containing protein n=1 Tax=Naematelia encephala TaxID=71784 RepID=A0A1Y2B4Y1_9TREE|nr:Indigoidine synthase A like protein-domain-containing protein [Naematelia encephala]
MLATARRRLLTCGIASSSRQRATRGLVDLAAARAAWGGRLVFSEEVENALHAGEAVVALESTIITHGMPYPTNLTCAQSVESIIRTNSAIPATIALIDGKVHVGLSTSQLEQLADPDLSGAIKVSRRDIGAVLARRLVGGTTVAGTMVVASSVGIGVFVTGGIGGVHRGAENSMDISADLIELGRTPMAVVCAGAKSILDIPRTLEVLETQGVCVATYGITTDFPAFYTPSSGMKSPWTTPDPLNAAQLIHASLSLPKPQSTLLAVPIPSEHSSAGAKVQIAVEQAVRESVEQGIDKRGKEVTPWLLKRVGELTAGSALNLNVKLIENNAMVGARVAVELAKLQKNGRSHASSSAYVSSSSPLGSKPITTIERDRDTSRVSAATSLPDPTVIVFGSAAIDITSTSTTPLSPRSTTPGTIHLSPGGVGRNIAEAAQNLLAPSSVQMVSLLGRSESSASEPDGFGKLLTIESEQSGLRTDGLVFGPQGSRTAACSLSLEGNGDLVAGVADMGIIETMTPELVTSTIEYKLPKMVVFDCNPRKEVLKAIIETCARLRIPTFADCTSIPKLPRLVDALVTSSTILASDTTLLPDQAPLTHISPNLIELDLLEAQFTASPSHQRTPLSADWHRDVAAYISHSERTFLAPYMPKLEACLPYVQSIWLKAGPHGLVHLGVSDKPLSTAEGVSYRPEDQQQQQQQQTAWLNLRHYPAIPIPGSEIVSTTGAGDTLAGGLVAGLVSGLDESDFVQIAMERVGRTMRSRRAVG